MLSAFLVMLAEMGAMLLVAKLIIDYDGPHPKTAPSSSDLKNEAKRLRLHALRVAREAEKLEQRVSNIS